MNIRIKVKRGNKKSFHIRLRDKFTGDYIDITTLNLDGAKLHFKINPEDAATIMELTGDIVTNPSEGYIYFTIITDDSKQGSDHDERTYYGDLLLYKDDDSFKKNLPLNDDEWIELVIERVVTI